MTSITQERRLLADVGRTLRLRSQWGSRYDYSGARTVDEPATRVFVHISVTNPRNYGSNDAHIRAIESIGISRFPATGVSYNRGHTPDGTAYELQPMGRRGAHTVNDFKRAACTTSGCPGHAHALTAPGRDWNLNYNARAYVIAQNTGDPVSTALVDSVARSIAADMLAGMVDRNAWIHGHRCVSSKSCPANPMWARMGELERRVSGYLLSGFTEEDDDMTAEQAAQLTAIANAITRFESDGPGSIEAIVWNQGRGPAVRQQINTIETGVAALSTQSGVDAVALAAALAPLLPTINQNTIEAALRSVLGSLDAPA
jgi:hypothetical protein